MVRKKYIILPLLCFASFASCMEGLGFIAVTGLGGGIVHFVQNSIRQAERAGGRLIQEGEGALNRVADRAIGSAAGAANGLIQNADAALEHRTKETRREVAGLAANMAGAAGDGANALRDSILRSEGLLPLAVVSIPHEAPALDLSGVLFEKIRGKTQLLMPIVDRVDRKTTDNPTPPAGLPLNVSEARGFVLFGLDELDTRFKDTGEFCRWLGSIASWQQAFLVLGMSEAWGYDVGPFGVINRLEGDNHRPFLDDLKQLVLRSSIHIRPWQILYSGSTEEVVKLYQSQLSGLRRIVIYLNANGNAVDRALLKEKHFFQSALNEWANTKQLRVEDIRESSFCLDTIRDEIARTTTIPSMFLEQIKLHRLDVLKKAQALVKESLEKMKDFTDSVIKREAEIANRTFVELGLSCPVDLSSMQFNAPSQQPALADNLRTEQQRLADHTPQLLNG